MGYIYQAREVRAVCYIAPDLLFIISFSSVVETIEPIMNFEEKPGPDLLNWVTSSCINAVGFGKEE